MTQEEFETADVIIKKSNTNGVADKAILDELPSNSRAIADFVNITSHLRDVGIIEIIDYGDYQYTYKLTSLGFEIQQSKKSYKSYLEGKKYKAFQDEYHKTLQIQDLETKLNTMNIEQLKFWNRQRWQFGLTIIVATAAFILSVINFIKSLVI